MTSSGAGKRQLVIDSMLAIIDAQGLDRLSVREVAAAAGVSIGTVQHYFPTKDDMMLVAFEQVAAQIRLRLGALTFTADLRRNLGAIARQLLPLTPERSTEARIHLAFAARAAVNPTLAAVQFRTLDAIQRELAAAVSAATRANTASVPNPSGLARTLLALVDGLALQSISAPGLLGPRQIMQAVDRLLDVLLGSATA